MASSSRSRHVGASRVSARFGASEQAVVPPKGGRGGGEVEDGHGRRRGREDYEELDRLLEEAGRSLADGDLRGANEALKRASVKAASM